MDDITILIDLVNQYSESSERNDLLTLLEKARNTEDLQEWDQFTKKFRKDYVGLMKKKLENFIPRPILALPGFEALICQLLDQALVNGDATSPAEISLGIASASLSLPALILKHPHLTELKPALIGFKPPSGLMLSFGGDLIGGGGGLDYQRKPKPQLSGAMGLKMNIVQVSALSILEEAGALTTLISARFTPGIQLGFGFAISGMGGLIGINRAVDTATLEAHFRSGALVNALFGDNPTDNATATLNTLSTVFRLRMGVHVFGPSMQLSWLKVGTFTLFNVDLGVFMQLPGPSRIDIIGSARAGIPILFQLRLDMRGEIDFARRVIGIHAIVVDSYVMGVFKLQGEAIFRMRYGDEPYVVLTLGGFYPGFNPSPAELPPYIQRIGMSLDLPIKLPLYLRVEGYLAVTSNTLQFGAHMEAGIDAVIFSAEGHFHLDAIFQFDPFADLVQ